MPVPEKDLPVILPTDQVSLTGKGGSPLAQLSEWVQTSCPSCGGPARRETDTMDTFMDSSWYFFRFSDPHNQMLPAAPQAIRKWLPVDVYVGGIEHAIMHLLYARFMARFMASEMGVANVCEPFEALITQGLVEGRTVRCPLTGRYLRPEEYVLDAQDPTKATLVSAPETLAEVSWEKMSKSKYNGVDPLDLVRHFGADTLRLCVLFKAPPEVPLRWNTRDISGPQRWLVRLLNLAERIKNHPAPITLHDPRANAELKSTLTKTRSEMENAYDPVKHRLNLAVANLMKLSNEIERHSTTADQQILLQTIESLAFMLHPIAPHTAAEIVDITGNRSVLQWPSPLTSE